MRRTVQSKRPIVLIDTNIIIDFYAKRAPFDKFARRLLLLAKLGEFEAYMSSSQITDIFYLLTSGPTKMDSSQAKSALEKLREALSVSVLHEEDIDRALESTWDDFEDACVHQVALNLHAEAIITRNKKDYACSTIKVFTCEEFFTYLENARGLTYDELPW